MDDRLLSLKWNNHKNTFFGNLKILREKSNYTDVTLAVEGKFYPVHKFVMSTCSEYFSDIFERTPCKSPVIVLKDVRSHDIESLLDYMYLGEVNVNQNDLTSLLKTAECLKIKGLAIPDEDPTNLHKNSTGSQDDAHQDSPPPKRRRHDSNTIPPHSASPVPSPQMSVTALINPADTPIPPHSSSNTSNTEQHEPPVVKVEIDDAEEQEERFRRENNYERGANSDRDRGGNYGSDISKTEHKPRNCGNSSFPGLSLQQFNHSTSNISSTGHNEPPVVKVEMDDAVEQEELFRRENNYEGGASSGHDPGGDYRSGISKTEHEPENYGSTSIPGPSLQEVNHSNSNTFNTFNTDQDEPPVVKFEMDDDSEQEQIFRRENNYEGGPSRYHDPGGDYRFDLLKIEHEPENDGNSLFPGTSLQQSVGNLATCSGDCFCNDGIHLFCTQTISYM